jgi:hypothetical protein
MTGIMEEVREGKEPSMAGHAKYPFFPDNIQLWYETNAHGASEFGEVMATVNRITSGDVDSWYNEWDATATRML